MTLTGVQNGEKEISRGNRMIHPAHLNGEIVTGPGEIMIRKVNLPGG